MRKYLCVYRIDGPYDPIPFFEDPLTYGLMICAFIFIYLLICKIQDKALNELVNGEY
ncbi:MAG: hypothetical protein V4677_02675 [Bacteroidota bacterium]